MNKNLFRLAGTILTFEALYIISLFVPVFVRVFSPQLILIPVVLSILLLLASGIGSLFIKKWSVITLWSSLSLSFLVSMATGHFYPSFILSSFLNWSLTFIVAVFLTLDWKKTKVI